VDAPAHAAKRRRIIEVGARWVIVNEETGQISSFLALWMIAYDAAQAAAPRLLGPRASPRLRLGSKILVPIPSVLAEAARDTGRAGAQADGHAGRGSCCSV